MAAADSSAPLGSPLASARLGRILVADADTSLLAVLCDMVAELGYDAHRVASAKAARHALQQQVYDVVLYDVGLDRQAALSLFAASTMSAPRAVMIAMAEQSPLANLPSPSVGFEAGFFETIRKPILSSNLGLLLARAMQVRHLQVENHQLRKHNASAKAAQTVKTDFLATMSHELRTPLNVIMGYLGLLQDGEFGPLTAAQDATIQRVNTNAQRLLDLVSFLLEANRLETGELLIEPRECDLSQLAQNIQPDVQRETQHNSHRAKQTGQSELTGVTVDWHIAAPLPAVYTDPDKLRIVLKSLIGNAVKFTERGSVTVEISPDQNGIQIRVSDTGIGIPAESLEVIFEPFHQLDSSASRDYEGVGLGLYMVKRLVELLGGTVSVESQVGQGSTFRVWLPLSAG